MSNWVWFRARMVGRNWCRRCGVSLHPGSCIWLYESAKKGQPCGPYCCECKAAVSLRFDVSVVRRSVPAVS